MEDTKNTSVETQETQEQETKTYTLAFHQALGSLGEKKQDIKEYPI